MQHVGERGGAFFFFIHYDDVAKAGDHGPKLLEQREQTLIDEDDGILCVVGDVADLIGRQAQVEGV